MAGTWVNGVWCPGLRSMLARPLSAPTPNHHSSSSRAGDSVRRPVSAPAGLLIHKAPNPDLERTELPSPGFPIPAQLPEDINATWLTKLLYDGNHLEPRSGIIVATVDEITDIYCNNG
eukprot:SAG22_NODE_1773_length_3610_cov_2.056394_2_plen_118_part_00